jgi:hypothetical protein
MLNTMILNKYQSLYKYAILLFKDNKIIYLGIKDNLLIYIYGI